jgi:hypothetical protein
VPCHGIGLQTELVFSMMVDTDIEAIISHGEERTAELNSKYAGLNLEDLNNFKSESMTQTWEGEDFQNKVCPRLAIFCQPTNRIFLSAKRLASTGSSPRSVREKAIIPLTSITRKRCAPGHPSQTRVLVFPEHPSNLPCKITSFSLLGSLSSKSVRLLHGR